jgi:hypothetical protein
LTDLHRALIAASRRGATRRLRLFIGGSLAVALIAAGLAGIAFWQWGVARQQKALAEQQRDIAERNEKRAEEERNGALVTQSRFLADLAAQRNAQGRTGEAMQLALEALPDEMEAKKRPLVREARQSLLKAFYQHAAELVVDRPGVTDGGGWGDDRVMFSADGARLTATAADGSAMIVSLADGSPLRSWLISAPIDMRSPRAPTSSPRPRPTRRCKPGTRPPDESAPASPSAPGHCMASPCVSTRSDR